MTLDTTAHTAPSAPPPLSFCPACGTSQPARRARLGSGEALLRCDACGHHFSTQTRSESKVAYNDHYSGFREDPVFSQAVREFIDASLRPRLPAGAKLLDLGCGNGEFMVAAAAAGYQVRGLDTSEAAVKLCRERGLQAAVGDFLDPAVARANTHDGVDLVTLWDVVEHLPDPHAFMRQVAASVRPGGMVFVKTPAIERLTLEVTRMAPRMAGALLQAPSHLQYFRKSSMTALLLRSGFRELDWLPSRSVRGKSQSGGLKKQVARRVVAAVHQASGDGNLLVFARTPARS
jgi:2-polyprenyl-3-methyl-5-hydroxy-6-metoxy-1,4-benzoquinol methylase